MGLLCRGVLLIAFILQGKVCNHKLCGTFCHFNMSLCLSQLERKDSMGIVLLSVIVSQIPWGAASDIVACYFFRFILQPCEYVSSTLGC
ncbi:hypothetical protein ACB092_03G221300 [Castanea dentata]